jgi:hypothetical protein
MTTTQNYNPLRNALVELTTPEAQRWYRTQAKTTATLAQTIAFRSFTTAQRLLGNSKPVALAAIAEPEFAQTIAPAVQDDSDTVAGLENAIAPSEAETIALATAPEQELDDRESDANAPRVRIAIDELEQAIAPYQKYAQAETIALELDLGDAIAVDGDADDVALDDDDDDTELRPWIDDEAEAERPSLVQEEEDTSFYSSKAADEYGQAIAPHPE